MAQPWSRILVEEDLGVIETYADGRMMLGLNVAMSNDDVERMRQGYKCIRCFENFGPEYKAGWNDPFPEACATCGFPCKDRQAEEFARAYVGYDATLRTGADWEAEADRLEDRAERRAFERRAAKSGIALGLKGVLIPKGLKD